MISKDNFRLLLYHLKFNENNDVFTRKYKNSEAYLKVDFNSDTIIYPLDKGFKVEGNYSTTFSKPEYFVVLECVHQLFKKDISLIKLH